MGPGYHLSFQLFRYGLGFQITTWFDFRVFQRVSLPPIFPNLEFVQIFDNDELVAYTREVRHIPVYYKFVSLLLITSEITLLTAIIVFVNKVIFFDLAHFQKKKR